MIINGFKCENCKAELQAEDVGVTIDGNGELVRICKFCQYETIIK